MLMHNFAESGNCYKVRLTAAQLELPLQIVEMDVDERETVLAELNPALELPTLVLDDGRVLAQSAAILLYLAEGTPLLPDDRYLRAQVTQWLFFEQTNHEPISFARLWLRWSDPADYRDRLEETQAAGYRALDVMESHLADHRFLVDERYTIADIALYAYTHIAGEGGFDLTRYPAITAWLDRVGGQPDHVPMVA